ncbi:MAG: succinate dehydrogenase assembly factor 2 [Marivivens sp.]|uniref:succinate dehydrogenase assembly factor 2 n=1 Tax=Marivivens sp. TaxID=1978374 RepID=UPI0018014C25|nr:succinate dehydrogenase assembly factor 2 [Marivivens sp.]NVJ94569.1 succinate dehydrogenase assembly factor 2 [Marivivens sp.]
MTELRDIRIKRLAMRSMRRGIKEMDLILSDFASRELSNMSDAELDHYENFMEEADLDLYQWISGQTEAPDQFKELVARISVSAKGLTAPRQ